MKLISWNVNGLRAVLGKGFGDFIRDEQPDIICLQETKARPEQVILPPELSTYNGYWDVAQKPGYSGVAIFTREKPLSVKMGLGIDEHDTEGRVLSLEYEQFFLVNVYTPNAQDGLRRLPYRLKWDEAFRNYVKQLSLIKPVIFCGDLNVAYEEIDIARPTENRFSSGFSDAERASFGKLLDAGFIDSFRFLYPELREAYSWWSFRAGARSRNIGWRLDYFCVSRAMQGRIKDAAILSQVSGSDHCPVSLTLI